MTITDLPLRRTKGTGLIMANKKVKNVKELNLEVEKIYDKIKQLENMIKELKQDLNNKLQGKTQEKGYFCCNRCKQHVETRKDLMDHIKENHPKNYKCGQCNFNSSTLMEIERHKMDFHGAVKELKCSKCESCFISEWRLQKHIQMHESNVNFCHFFQ